MTKITTCMDKREKRKQASVYLYVHVHFTTVWNVSICKYPDVLLFSSTSLETSANVGTITPLN